MKTSEDDPAGHADGDRCPQKTAVILRRTAGGKLPRSLPFISVMIYEALMNLYPETEKDTVFQIPHEYRKALGRPLSHDCLARDFYVKLAAKDRDKPLA